MPRTRRWRCRKVKEHSAVHTGLGLVALLLWSTSVACTRGLAERIGIFDTVAITMAVGGALGVAYLGLVRRALGEVLRLPRRYLLGGLALFTAYMAAYNLAIALGRDHATVLEAGLINYLWPGLTLVLAVPILRKRATPWLLPGLLLGLAGVAIATLGPGYTVTALGARLQQNALVYLLALVAAVTWALFSNLSRAWAGHATAGATPLFLLASGLLMGAVGRLFPHPAPGPWSAGTWGLLAFVTLGPTLLAYVCWEYGMRKGHLILLASLSFFTPLVSTVISSLTLGYTPGLNLWAACALIIAGAAICHASVRERVDQRHEETRAQEQRINQS